MGTVSSGEILYDAPRTTPFSSIIMTERMIPETSLPYIIFLPNAPYAFATDLSRSESRVKLRLYFSSNILRVSGLSGLMPIATIPFLANSALASLTETACLVQPDVRALP